MVLNESIKEKIREISKYSKNLIKIRDNKEENDKAAFKEAEKIFVNLIVDVLLDKLKTEIDYRGTVVINVTLWSEFKDYCRYIHDDAFNRTRNSQIKESLEKYGFPRNAVFEISRDSPDYEKNCCIRFSMKELSKLK